MTRRADSGLLAKRPTDYSLTYIPIQKALLFRTTAEKNNPEAAPSCETLTALVFKRRIEEIEAIGIERDLAGFPVMYVDPEIMRDDTCQANTFNDYKEAVVNIRRDQQEGMILPSIYDDSGNQLYRLELLSSGGKRRSIPARSSSVTISGWPLLGRLHPPRSAGRWLLCPEFRQDQPLRRQPSDVPPDHPVGDERVRHPRALPSQRDAREGLPELMFGEIKPSLTETGTFIQQLAGRCAVVPR